jgi:mono/diheme cytochrome c family protein
MTHRLHQRAGLGVAVALSTLALAACGSSGTGTGTATGTGSGSGAGSTQTGKQIFLSVGCSGCHTLAAAGAHGNYGPNLDNLKPSEAAVVKQVTNGGGGMPAFASTLSSAEIKRVAQYVSSAAGA